MSAFPETVTVPFAVLQQAFLALQAAGRVPVLHCRTKEDVQAVIRAECAAIVLKAHVQRAINAAEVEA